MNICRKLLLFAGTGVLTVVIFIGAALADGLVVVGFLFSEPQTGSDLRMEQLAAKYPPRIRSGSIYDFAEFPVGGRSAKTGVEAVTSNLVVTVAPGGASVIARWWSKSGPDREVIGADWDAIPETVSIFRLRWPGWPGGSEAKS